MLNQVYRLVDPRQFEVQTVAEEITNNDIIVRPRFYPFVMRILVALRVNDHKRPYGRNYQWRSFTKALVKSSRILKINLSQEH